jgi:hypothetical protein
MRSIVATTDNPSLRHHHASKDPNPDAPQERAGNANLPVCILQATLPWTRVEQTDKYRDWIDSLKDQVGRARILMRVDRLIHGNPGLHRNLTGGCRN